MNLMVPTILCDTLVLEKIETPGREYKPGEIATFPYGVALQLRALGVVGAFQDELAKHAEAAEGLKVYGGDCWFSPVMQTISRVGEYLASRGEVDPVQ